MHCLGCLPCLRKGRGHRHPLQDHKRADVLSDDTTHVCAGCSIGEELLAIEIEHARSNCGRATRKSKQTEGKKQTNSTSSNNLLKQKHQPRITPEEAPKLAVSNNHKEGEEEGEGAQLVTVLLCEFLLEFSELP